jgi:branched-chain amino acid transport system substrate-binding protein
MRGFVARSRALGASAAVAATIAGCTAAGSSAPTLNGKTLTIYLSAPTSLQTSQQTEDVVNAEKLAFQQLQGQVTAYRLNLAVVTHDKISDNARQAIGDTGHAIAYIGEVPPGDSADSIGITNAQDLLQVSATDTAAELTQKTPAVPNAPTKYYESLGTYGRTFARVVPTTKIEANALVHGMHSVGVKRVFITDDGSAYGRTLATAVRNVAVGAVTSAPTPTGANAMLFAGSNQSAAARAFNQAVTTNPRQKLFAPSALANDGFVAMLSAAARRNLSVSAPGLLPKELASGDATFLANFRSAYGRAPSTQAIFGYEAMSAVLAVLREAGSSANNRTTVVHDFFAIRNRSSPVGTYSIDQNGDTSLGQSAFVIEQVKGARLVAVQVG